MVLFIEQGMKEEANKVLQNILNIVETHLGISSVINAFIFDKIASFLEEVGANTIAFDFLLTTSKLIETYIGKQHHSRVSVTLTDPDPP